MIISQGRTQFVNDDCFYLGCRNSPPLSGATIGLSRDRLERIISVAPALLVGMGGGEAISPMVVQKACKEACLRGAEPNPVFVAVGGKLRLGGIPNRSVDDGPVLSLVAPTLMGDLAEVGRVRQELVNL